MNIKKHIPNFLTCCNLLSGCVGIIAVSHHNLILASYCIYIACVFDFLDGFAARGLKVSSAIGKDLDSLSDLVSFGVLPGMIMFGLMAQNYWIFVNDLISNVTWALPIPRINNQSKYYGLIPFFSLIIPVFSALRLAKFNNDTRQSDRFIGLPTPANALFISAIPFMWNRIMESENELVNYITIILIALSCILSYLLVADLPLIALKFKNFGWPDNKMRYLLIITSLILLLILNFTAIPIIIILYIILSIIDNKLRSVKQ
jgi:CDP-diacylglycerol--serine O-phosphatidyltransferase